MQPDQGLADEAKGLVALAFRNGPIEDLHAGAICPTCAGKVGYSHVTQEEMKAIMKNAVNVVYRLLWLRDHDPESFGAEVKRGLMFTDLWDEPDPVDG